MLPTCWELGIGFVAYSPLGRGFLTGAIRQRSDLDQSDWRLANPRFSEENFHHNLKLVETVQAMANELGCSSAQLALAWMLAQSPHIVPIPGTRNLDRLGENAAAAEIELGSELLAKLDEVIASASIYGERYPEGGMALLMGDTPERVSNG